LCGFTFQGRKKYAEAKAELAPTKVWEGAVSTKARASTSSGGKFKNSRAAKAIFWDLERFIRYRILGLLLTEEKCIGDAKNKGSKIRHFCQCFREDTWG
jgi:hypothetical protein